MMHAQLTMRWIIQYDARAYTRPLARRMLPSERGTPNVGAIALAKSSSLSSGQNMAQIVRIASAFSLSVGRRYGEASTE